MVVGDLRGAAPVVGGSMKLQKKMNIQKIEQAIADFEMHVDFEFVPVIARRSSYIEHISWVLSLLFLILFIGCIDIVFAHYMHDSYMSPLGFYIAAPFVAVIVGVLLDKSDLVDRFFITKAERIRQVQEKAELIFYRHKLHELDVKKALVLYVSIMERQIVLFHDPRIKLADMQKIDNDLLKILQESFQKNDYEAGLLKAISHLKSELLPHFPPKNGANDQNFVPNKLIWL